MSKLSEFHRKNNFEYISFLISELLNKIKEVQDVQPTGKYR